MRILLDPATVSDVTVSNAFPTENTDLTVSCNVTHFGFPKSTITWLRDDVALSNQAKDTVITISKIRRSENGVRYTCRVKNAAQQTDKSTVLKVAWRGVITRVSADKHLPKEFDSVSLTCDISDYGNPRSNVSWFRNDSTSFNFDTSSTSLTLQNVSRNDAGVYFCKLSNVVDHPVAVIKLHVACKRHSIHSEASKY